MGAIPPQLGLYSLIKVLHQRRMKFLISYNCCQCDSSWNKNGRLRFCKLAMELQIANNPYTDHTWHAQIRSQVCEIWPKMRNMVKFGIWGAYLGAPNMVNNPYIDHTWHAQICAQVCEIWRNMRYRAKYGIWGAPNMVKWGVPKNILQKSNSEFKRVELVSMGPPSQNLWPNLPNLPIAITM